MNRDKKVLYTVSVLYLCTLFLACFVTRGAAGKLILAAVSVSTSAAVFFLIRKRSIHGIEKKQVTALMAAIAVICVTVYYLTGIGFGFYKVLLLPSFIWKYIIPYVIIIVSSEIARSVFLAQKNRTVTVLSYISFVILDFAMLSGSGVLGSFGKFMDAFGMVLLPALTSNLMYHFLSSKYGMFPNIVYKTIISLYPYLIPLKPQMPDSMLSFAKIVIPLLIFILISSMYRRRKFVSSGRHTRARVIAAVLTLVLMTACMMLISCKFRYGLLVIGSESMTGEVNKGDAIIYEQYDDQIIEEGQVIVFVKNDTTVIHRVIDIKKINGEVRYYTKGDANEGADAGYITADKIIGITNLKIKFIGYPTLWVRSLFK